MGSRRWSRGTGDRTTPSPARPSPRSGTHRRPRTASRSRARRSLKSSTALSAAPRVARWGDTLANYGATVAVIACGVWFYTRDGGYQRNELVSQLALPWSGLPVVRTSDLLGWLGWTYTVILLPYYA